MPRYILSNTSYHLVGVKHGNHNPIKQPVQPVIAWAYHPVMTCNTMDYYYCMPNISLTLYQASNSWFIVNLLLYSFEVSGFLLVNYIMNMSYAEGTLYWSVRHLWALIPAKIRVDRPTITIVHSDLYLLWRGVVDPMHHPSLSLSCLDFLSSYLSPMEYQPDWPLCSVVWVLIIPSSKCH